MLEKEKVMFRKMMLSGLTVLGLGFGMFGANSAQARDRDDRRDWRDHDGRGGWSEHRELTRYKVFYKRGFRGEFRLYETFDSEWRAREAERRLEREGFNAFVREVRERC